MKLSVKEWVALAAALLLPTVLFAASKKSTSNTTALSNLKAFLLMIQFSEGTLGNKAYRMLYGGNLFDDFSKHPNIPVTRWGITSTAAGAYQFLYSTWTELQLSLRLPDFSPASQNKAAIELIRRGGAIDDILRGHVPQAINKCRKIWASFPGAGYGQSEKSLQDLLLFYEKAGGQMATT
ncbi:MAG TPA: glycoside hydrolase family 104 protein [Chitinophagaceae bacterium]